MTTVVARCDVKGLVALNRRTTTLPLVALVVVVATLLSAGSETARADDPPLGPGTAGPPYEFTTELKGQYDPGTGLRNKAKLNRTRHGYRYWAGQQDSRIRVTRTATGALRFADRGTRRWVDLARSCRRVPARRGIAAVCRVPDVTRNRPLLVEIWPRIGNDFVDASALPATFAVTVLGDKGHDTALFGAGWDFFNGFSGRDVVRGGPGNDWIRSGLENDRVVAGRGDDQVVDTAGHDRLAGGAGKDRLGAGPGNDRLVGGPGADTLLCGTGADVTDRDRADRRSDC